MLNQSRRRLWVHGPKPEYKLDDDWADQWYIAARILALVRPGIDLVILPGGNQQLRDFTNFCCGRLGLDKSQILWTSGIDYLLDDGIKQEVFEQLIWLLYGNDWDIIPYSVTKPFLKWASKLNGVRIVGDNELLTTTYCNKGILHPSPIPELRNHDLPLLRDVNVPRGFYCCTSEELRMAFQKLSSGGVDNIILKPAFGTTGEGIIKNVSFAEIKQYAFSMGTVILEEMLNIDCDEGGNEINPSVQYIGKELVEKVTDQFISSGCAHVGNIIPSQTSVDFQLEAMKMAMRVIEFSGARGPGGVDFLSVGGRPVLIDPNVGRFTGAHSPYLFRYSYAQGMNFISWKFSSDLDVYSLWGRLKQYDIAFDPKKNNGKGGIFPLCHLPGMWSMAIGLGDSREDLFKLKDKFEDIVF